MASKNGVEKASPDVTTATFTAEFEKFGDDFIWLTPEVFIPIDEFISDFAQFIKEYILRKGAEFYGKQT